MSIIYRTYDGNYEWINGVKIKAVMTHEENENYEKLVNAGLMIKEEADDEWILAGENISDDDMMLIGDLSDGKLVKATGSSIFWYGVIAKGAESSKAAAVIRSGRAVVKVGEADLSASTQIVAGPGGKAVAYKSTQVTLMDQEQGAASDDFDNSVWGASGDYPCIRTSVDNEDDRGIEVILHVINTSDEYTTITLTLDELDSSDVVQATTKIKALVGVYVNDDITGTLIIENTDGDDCKTFTSPTEGWAGGSIEVSGSNDTYGHAVVLLANHSVTGSVVVIGTDGNDEEQSEIVEFSSATSASTTLGYNTITRILIGNDGNDTEYWSIYVDADAPESVVGTTMEAASAGTNVTMSVALAAGTAVGPGTAHTHTVGSFEIVKYYDLGAPEAADTDSVLTAVNLTNTTYTPDHQPDVARAIQVTIVDTTPSITAGTVTINGTDINGNHISEALDCSAGAGTYETVKAFETITSIVASGFTTLEGSGDETISVGCLDIFGLPYKPSTNVCIVYVDGSSELGTIDETNWTVEPTTSSDGTKKFIASYTYTVNPVVYSESNHRHALLT